MGSRQLAVVLSVFSLPFSALADSSQDVCGSPAAYARSHAWRDLPGCLSDPNPAGGHDPDHILFRAKDAFSDFFKHWEHGQLDQRTLSSDVGGCDQYDNGYEEWGTVPKLQAAKPAFDDMKARVKLLMSYAPALSSVSQDYAQVNNFIDGIRKGDKQAKELGHDFAVSLSTDIDAAIKLNIPDDAPVNLAGTEKVITFAEMKGMINKMLEETGIARAQFDAVHVAAWAPYTKLLSGEKKAQFETWTKGDDTGHMEGIGHHGKRFTSPKEFAASDVWYWVTTDKSGLIPVYRVEGYKFNGSKKAGNYYHELVGREPSGKDFP